MNILLDGVPKVPQSVFTALNSVFISLRCLGEFHCFVFQLIDSFLCLSQSAAEPLCCIFQLNYNFCLAFACIFCLSVEVLTVLVHSFPEFNGYLYDLTVNIIPGRLCVSGFVSSFSEVLSCSFDGDLFLCLLVLSNSLFSVLVSWVSQLPLQLPLKGQSCVGCAVGLRCGLAPELMLGRSLLCGLHAPS